MKKALLLMCVAIIATGCTTQPAPNGKSKDETLSKNRVKVFTLDVPMSIGGTHITAESGSHITISR